MGYNHVVAFNNYNWVQQERFKLLQDSFNQFITYRKVCEQLGLKVGTSKNGGSNILMNIDNSTQLQKEEAEKKAIQEHLTIQFMWVPRNITNWGHEECLPKKKKAHSLKLSQRHVMYFQNGEITMEENTKIIKLNTMTVLPLQKWQKKKKQKNLKKTDNMF